MIARHAVSTATCAGYAMRPALPTTANGVIVAGSALARVLMWTTGIPRASS